MCNINHPKSPFKIFGKNVHDKDKAVQCDLCELWIHIKCNNLNHLDYRYLRHNFAFQLLIKQYLLACCTNTDSNITQWKDPESDHNSSLSLKPSLKFLVNQFNNATQENSTDPEKIASSKYYGNDEMHDIEIPHKKKKKITFLISYKCMSS